MEAIVQIADSVWLLTPAPVMDFCRLAISPKALNYLTVVQTFGELDLMGRKDDVKEDS